MRGHSGQGLLAARSVGRRGEQFEVDDARGAVAQRVPMQSAPVSPPPMTMTFCRGRDVGLGLELELDDEVAGRWIGRPVQVAVAVEQALGVAGEEVHRVVDADEVAAGAAAGGVERLGGAGAEEHGVELVDQVLRVDELHLAAALLHDLRHVAGGEILLPADVGAGDERDAFVAELVDAALDDALVELHVRDAVHQQAADAVGPLVDGDRVAGLVELRGGGEARRGRCRRSATFLPVRYSGGCGWIQPSSQPRSMIAFSMFLIVTGGLVMPSTHAPSHGAGQVRPVNSGKLLVLWSRSSALRQRPW